jgi:SAM-dependent methyltransferase
MTSTTADASSAALGTDVESPLFDRFEHSYNLLHPSERDGFFVELVRDVIRSQPAPRRVADIGCGSGIGTKPELIARLRPECDELIGVEPDVNVDPAPGVFTALHRSTFEECEIPDDSVDVAFSCMVMEHVVDPARFMARLERVLRPGGKYIFMTVNGAHYFALISNALRRIGVDEHVLRMVRGGASVDSYHYPTAYRFNDPERISSVCASVGMPSPRFVFAEHPGARCYFPGPTKMAWHALTLKRKVVRRPELLLELIGLVTKPERAAASHEPSPPNSPAPRTPPPRGPCP